MTTGVTSFTSVRLIVTVCAADVLTPSETVTDSVKLVVSSRSKSPASLTVIAPVEALIANGNVESPSLSVFPAVIVQVWNVVAVTSPSVASTVPTAVVAALFSVTLKL